MELILKYAYQDLIQPSAKELGNGALLDITKTVNKSVNIALSPITSLIWGYDQIKDFITEKLSEKLKKTPLSDIITPKPNIVCPAIEALRYSYKNDFLKELYADLIASSMDAATTELAHPSFVEIIKQMTSDEAKLMKYFSSDRAYPLINVREVSRTAGAGGKIVLHNFSLLGEKSECENKELIPSYLDNLRRLGLIEIPEFLKYTPSFAYDELVNHNKVKKIMEEIKEKNEFNAVIERKGIAITQFGRQFITAVVINHEHVRNIINEKTKV
jgi:hypothetical protein